MAKRKLKLKGSNLTSDELLKHLEELGVELAEDQSEETIDEPVRKPKQEPKMSPRLPKLPTPGLKKAPIKRKELKIEGSIEVGEDIWTKEEFETFCLEYNIKAAEKNRLNKETGEDREAILAVMGDNVHYDGTECNVSISPTKNEWIDAQLVVQQLLEQDCEHEVTCPHCEESFAAKKDVTASQLIDLARLGIISINKGNFERWLKSAGCDAAPFIVVGKPTKRLSVKPKIKRDKETK